MEKNEVCCNEIKWFLVTWQWNQTREDDELMAEIMYVMPNINTFRVNFCPCCGKNIRDIRFTEKEIKRAMK
jgi:hypothetical protein